MKRFIIIFGILLVVIFIGTSIYINNVFIPVTLKNLVTEKISEVSGRSVTIDNISFSFIRGFTLHDIRIHGKNPDNPPFISCKRISFGMLYLPILKQRQIIIPSLDIEKPTVILIRETENMWNFSDIIEKMKSTSRSESKNALLVKDISVSDGVINFSDLTPKEMLEQKIQDIKISATGSLKKIISFSIEGIIPHEKTQQKISATGSFDISLRKLTADIKTSDINLAYYLSKYGIVPQLNIKTALTSPKAFLTYEKGLLMTDLKGQLEDLHLVFPGDINFYGEPSFDLSFSYRPKTKRIYKHAGSINFSDARITEVPYLENIEKINGIVDISPNMLKTEDIKFAAHDTDFKLKGSLAGFKDPFVNATISSDIALYKIQKIFSDIFTKSEIGMTGNASTSMSYRGHLKKPDEAKINITAKIEDATLKANALPSAVEDISIDLLLTPESLSLKDFQATFNNEIYRGTIVIANFKKPSVSFIFESKLISCASRIEKINDVFKIVTLSGSYKNSEFDMKGNLSLKNIVNPYLNISGEVQVELSDIKEFIPKYTSIIEKINPLGKFVFNGSLKGSLGNWRNWNVDIAGSSPLSSFYEYNLENVNLKYVQKDKAVEKFDISADGYSGLLNFASSANLNDADIPYEFTITADNVNLAKLKKDTAWRDKDISGTLSASAQAEGRILNIETLNGYGSLLVQDGHVWQLNLFEGLGKFLFIPEYRDITFKKAQGNFIIRDKKISTDNFSLISDPVDLECYGWIDFSGNLNFDIYSKFSEDAIEKSSSLKKTITAILTQTDDYLTIKLTGTLKEPKYLVVPSSVNVADKARNLIFKGLESIFE